MIRVEALRFAGGYMPSSKTTFPPTTVARTRPSMSRTSFAAESIGDIESSSVGDSCQDPGHQGEHEGR